MTITALASTIATMNDAELQRLAIKSPDAIRSVAKAAVEPTAPKAKRAPRQPKR
jgi:hypothetical protein